MTVHTIITALARITHEATISNDECSSIGAPSECRDDIEAGARRAAIAALTENNLSCDELHAIIEATSVDDLRKVIDTIREEIPNPFVWTPPTEPFCSVCDKRPSWWAAATVEERRERGYRLVLADPEERVYELQYRGCAHLCDDCLNESADEFAGMNDDADEANDEAGERMWLGMFITRYAVDRRQYDID